MPPGWPAVRRSRLAATRCPAPVPRRAVACPIAGAHARAHRPAAGRYCCPRPCRPGVLAGSPGPAAHRRHPPCEWRSAPGPCPGRARQPRQPGSPAPHPAPEGGEPVGCCCGPVRRRSSAGRRRSAPAHPAARGPVAPAAGAHTSRCQPGAPGSSRGSAAGVRNCQGSPARQCSIVVRRRWLPAVLANARPCARYARHRTGRCNS